MISVVITLYNKEKHIRNTLKGVLGQSFQDFEIVVVDDGSTDNSVSEVQRFKDPRIRIISQTNAGVSAARNRGILESKGEFIALLDGDDEWKPDYLATQYALAEKYPECDVFATDYEFRSNDGKISPTIIKRLHFDSEDGVLTNYFEIASHSHPPLWTSAIMVSKNALELIGGFPYGIKSVEDLLTWARLACRHKIAYSRKPMAVFNIEGYDLKEKPKRYPAFEDKVGYELKRLRENHNQPFLRFYISHWHKMRSSVYMRLGIRKHSIKEAIKGLKYNPMNYKLYAYILLNLLPKKLQPF